MGTSSETATYVGGFSSTALSNKPDDSGADGKRANGAAEIRQLKKIIKDSFANVTGAVTASHTELNQLDGVSVGGNTAGDIVTTDDTQTLTNKTLTSPTINGGVISGITDLAVADGGTGASNAAGARTNLDVPSTTGSGASGTWGISISGNATTATTANALNTGNSYTVADMTVNTTLNVRGAVDLADNDILRFGTGDDCKLFCDGSHMYMDLNSEIGNFYIRDGTTTRFTFDDAGDFTTTGNIGIGETSPDYKLDVNGAIGFTPGPSVTPVDNGDVVIELTNDTTLTFKAKGSDGQVRTRTITLA